MFFNYILDYAKDGLIDPVDRKRRRPCHVGLAAAVVLAGGRASLEPLGEALPLASLEPLPSLAAEPRWSLAGG